MKSNEPVRSPASADCAEIPCDPISGMTPRFNLWVRWFSRRYFRHFELGEETTTRLKALEARGTVIYVMRYSSRLDYFLFNTLFQREGLRLSGFANGLRFYYYRPVGQILKTLLFRKRGQTESVSHGEDQRKVRQLTRAGGSFFLFLRTKRLRTFLRGLSRSKQRHDELDLLQEVVREAWNGNRPVFLVPLLLFWRKGPRSQSRFLRLDYGSLSRPSDVTKIGSFLATYRSLQPKVGEAIDLSEYIASHRSDGQERVARVVRRSILIYLYREEKVVEGPTLRSQQRLLREILADEGVRAAMVERASRKRGSMEKAERDVEKFLREVAARQSSTLLAILAALVGYILRRMFNTIETDGLPEVAEYAKRYPLVLVPNHRSYFDFLIISVLFYQNYLVPPHIAARDNMRFGPFGLIFRMAGAYYLRRSFDDPLYKQVFRAYIGYLVREGFTQEFFIEGGRSRTGKTLAPRLGMLTWNIDAFLESARRDLFFVPVAISYERLVEERGMVDELEGGEKTEESTLALLRAGKYLRSRFGTVHVNFGKPISLTEAMGERRAELEAVVHGDVVKLLPEDVRGDASAVESLEAQIQQRKHEFIQDLGYRLVERINWSMVANATSVVATVLLGFPHRGLLRKDLVARAKQVVGLLSAQGVHMTSALSADRADFSESIAFMLRADLIKSVEDARGELIFYPESRRRALDLYRNAIVHFLATPSQIARRLGLGATMKELREDLSGWQEVLYHEYFVPRSDAAACEPEAFISYFEAEGWVERSEDVLLPTLTGEGILACLAAQTLGVIECYEALFRAVHHAGGEITKKELMVEAGAGFERSGLLGLAHRVEAANETTFGNALDLLIRREILTATRVPRRGGAPETALAPGEEFWALEGLLARLAGAATPR